MQSNVFLMLMVFFSSQGNALEFINGAYEDFVFQITDSVPVTECQTVLGNLKNASRMKKGIEDVSHTYNSAFESEDHQNLLPIEAASSNVKSSELKTLSANVSHSDTQLPMIEDHQSDKESEKYFKNDKQNISKKGCTLKKKMSKTKQSSTKLQAKSPTNHKQRSIYVIPKEIRPEPQTAFSLNLGTVPEEEPSSTVEEDTAIQPQQQLCYQKHAKPYKRKPQLEIPFPLFALPQPEIMENDQSKCNRMQEPRSYEYSKDYLNKGDSMYLSSQEPFSVIHESKHHTTAAADEDDSSWYDLSEDESSCTVRVGSVDGAGDTQDNLKITLKSYLKGNKTDPKEAVVYEKKICNLMEVIRQLRRENSVLNDYLQNCGKQFNAMSLPVEKEKAETSINNLSTEVNALKERLQELSTARPDAKGDTFTEKSSKLRKTALVWKAKYEVVSRKNVELKAFIDTLEKKLDNVARHKHKETTDLKERLSELYDKEMDALKQSHTVEIKELENSYSQKLIEKEKEFCEKLEELQKDYDKNIADTKAQYQDMLTSKDSEIMRLESLIQEQCLRMQREVKHIRDHMEQNAQFLNGDSVDKIVFLQKCIFKMEKLFKKSQRNYAKQVANLKWELSLKNKALEDSITSASNYLFSALDSRAFLRSATVVLPSSWPDSCAPKPVISGSGDWPDVTILPRGPTRGRIWTQQSAGCGQPGDQIYLGYESLLERDDSLGRSLIKEFAKYRYGVFEEQGYYNDAVYPTCFYDDQTKTRKVTGCSDLPIKNNGICENPSSKYNVSEMVDEFARSSIMFAAEAPSISMFCDEGNHDRFAPTKHNQICNRRSTFEVIMTHSDFSSNNAFSISNEITNTTPKILYKKQNLTRYVLVIENTKDMLERESWNYLRVAIRKWAGFDLPENTEVGVLLANETGSTKLLKILTLKNSDSRDVLSSNIPYTPGDSGQPACLFCALRDAINMLNEASKYRSAARNVIILIAPGIDKIKELEPIVAEANKLKIKIATVNYPDVFRAQPLDYLATGTNGVAFTVTEIKYNIAMSMLTTYFQLTNVFYSITERFYSGNPSDLPMEIHRRKLTDDGRTSVTGSFVLEENMSEPAKFMLYTHNVDSPLIRGLTLISPSHQEFNIRSESMQSVKIITLVANITEPGTWTYTIERYSGNPQPHFIQVMATPKSKTVPVVRAKFWTHRNQPGGALILFAEVRRGNFPVLGAKVEAIFTKAESNGTMAYSGSLELLDTGSGDPDVTKGDGIYSRYFSAAPGGPGTYTFDVTITDNGNTAYTWMHSSRISEEKPCCGSVVPTSSVQPLSPFQRCLPPITITITSEDILRSTQVAAGRIGDLKVQVKPEDMKALLTWTSPDMGGNKVARYEIKYAKTVKDIVDEYETAAKIWEHANPHALAPGSETTVTIDMNKAKQLLDQPLYFAVKAFPQLYSDSQASAPSNWVRLLVPSPPPPPTVPPTFPTSDHSSWPHNNINSVGIDPIAPTTAKNVAFGLEIVLPVVIGILILAAILALYCYFCVIKRRGRDNHKKTEKNSNGIKTDKLSSTVTIVPGTPSNTSQTNSQQGYTNVSDIPDPHSVGVPVNNYAYDDDTKKRYSLVHQQEQQLIEELKQQQLHHQQQHDQLANANNNYGAVSVISNNSLQRNGGHTLSPYNSWSASQLLHEHERRHSPLENMIPEDQMVPSHQEMLINGSQADHMSLSGQTIDHISMNGHQIPNTVQDHYDSTHAPPVPPLPAYSPNGYSVNYNIYGVQGHQLMPHTNNQPIYQTMQRNDTMGNYSTSLQGSLSSVNSGEKKRRNVTMV